MGKRKNGGASLRDPEVDALLGEMVSIAETQAGGAPKRPYVAISEQSGSPVPEDDVVPSAAKVQKLEPSKSVLKTGMSTLLEKIQSDAQATRDQSEQAVVDGLSFAYDKVKGTLAPTAIASALVLNPTPIGYVMSLAKVVMNNIPSLSWETVVANYGSTLTAAGETAMSAASMAGTPQGVLLIGGILLGAAANGAGKSIPEYLKDVGTGVGRGTVDKAKSVVADIKKEFDRVVGESPATQLNAEVKKRMSEREREIAVAAYLDIAKAKDAAEAKKVEEEAASALTALMDDEPAPAASAPATKQKADGGRRRKTKKRSTKKRRVTRRRTMPTFSY